MGKTQKIMVGVSMTALTLSLTGCDTDSNDLPPKPNDQDCSEWEWGDDEGVWACDDNSSSYYGHYYYGGNYYNNKNSLLTNSDYNSYKNSSSFKGGNNTSSGFGNGSNHFGG